MKLNRKGMTLVEIIISVGLIAMVMVFLFKILVDIRHEGTMSSTNTKDMVNRTEIITKIQDKIMDNVLTKIGITKKNESIEISIHTSVGEYMVVVENKKISFDGQTWELHDASAGYDLCNITTEVVEDTSQPNSHFYVRLLIPVKLNNKSNHSSYDIEISYIGKKFSSFESNNYQSGPKC